MTARVCSCNMKAICDAGKSMKHVIIKNTAVISNIECRRFWHLW